MKNTVTLSKNDLEKVKTDMFNAGYAAGAAKLDLSEKDLLEIRTLTKTPEKYGYIDILRRINGYFYIRNSFGMRVAVWEAFFIAVGQMKDATSKAFTEYLDKKEKPNGTR